MAMVIDGCHIRNAGKEHKLLGPQDVRLHGRRNESADIGISRGGAAHGVRCMVH